jgi:hypothetical protein
LIVPPPPLTKNLSPVEPESAPPLTVKLPLPTSGSPRSPPRWR